jgi:hypothetical protein
MIRGFTSVAAAVAIIAVLLAAPCFACADLLTPPCCNPANCKNSPTTPAADLAIAKQTSELGLLAHSLALPASTPVPAHFSVLNPERPVRAPEVPAFSPPDLNVLHSVLNV